MESAYYSSFESFALVDGPGVRSVLFLAGCPNRCLYCHNPETWDTNNKEIITSIDALKKLERFAPYWKDNGGITISGGEPLLYIDFLIELFTLAKEKGYSTCIDTSGTTFNDSKEYLVKFDKLLSLCDLILLDIKGIDNSLHKKITGVSNTNVLKMFNYLNNKNYPIWIRYVLVPNLTDSLSILSQTKSFVEKLNNVYRFEVLPYHSFAINKYKELNIDYPLINTLSPTNEEIQRANDILQTNKYLRYKKDRL